MDRLIDQEILQKTIDYCVEELGIKELKLADIGKVPRQPSSYAEICSQDKLPKLITYDVLSLFASHACREHGFDAVNYFAHFGTGRVVEDLRDMGLPEYSLELLVEVGYIGSRQKNVYRISDEELLRDSLISLEKKYGKKKVERLKKRLGISEIREDLIREHYEAYGNL